MAKHRLFVSRVRFWYQLKLVNQRNRFAFISSLLCIAALGLSLKLWLEKPNNFLYTIEPNGVWNKYESFNYKASGFSVKLDALCAAPIYRNLEKQKRTEPYDIFDFQRFLSNRSTNVSFAPQEISFPSRFKWLKDTYIAYDDPTLFSGTRASFKNKCLYDKECLLADSLDYLFIKIGIKYFLTEAHAEFLKSKCIEHEKVFYRINNNYNFGHSDLSYRNGLLIWIQSWYNLLLVLILGACVLHLVYFRRIK